MNRLGFDELSRMIFQDQSDAICRFVEEHPDTARLQNGEGDTLLHLACWAKRIDAVHALLAAAADVNARDSGRTPLHYAVHEGDRRSVPIVRALLGHGAVPNVMDSNGFTQAEWARIEMDEGLAEVLELLEGAVTGVQDLADVSKHSLHQAVRRGDLDTVGRILREHPALVDYRDQHGDTPLLAACMAKQLGMVGVLAALGADLNAGGNGGRTALHYAVEHASAMSWPLVGALLNAGADPRIRDDLGLTPADSARHQRKAGLSEVLELLLDAGQVFEAGKTWQQHQLSRSIEGLSKQVHQIKSAGGDVPVLERVIASLRELEDGRARGEEGAE